jgi:hypothetical protein
MGQELQLLAFLHQLVRALPDNMTLLELKRKRRRRRRRKSRRRRGEKRRGEENRKRTR